VGLAGALMLPATEDLEDQLVALVAVFAQQDVEALEGGRGERLKAVPREHRPDLFEGAFPELLVAREEITGTRWRVELRWHAPMFPDIGHPRHIEYPAKGVSRRPLPSRSRLGVCGRCPNDPASGS